MKTTKKIEIKPEHDGVIKLGIKKIEIKLPVSKRNRIKV